MRVLGKIVLALVGLAVVLAALAAFLMRVPTPDSAFHPFPAGRACAIAITDDTDYFAFETVAPVYGLIDSLGLTLTKTVWAFDAEGVDPASVGLSLENDDYRAWVLEGAVRGHEITLHTATARHDDRETMLAAYDVLEDLTGERPRLEIFHSYNREAFYWGSERLPNPVLEFLHGLTHEGSFEGATEGSPYYWVDLSRGLVRYVRSFTTNDINTLALNPSMPYEDARTPMAPLWFASSNGREGDYFVSLFAEENVDRLKRERGVSIVYTHFASDFVEEARGGGRRPLRRDVRECLTRMGRDGEIEFVTAGDLLDRLRLIQFIEDALAGGDPGTEAGRTGRTVSSIAVASGLAPAIDGISVDPGRFPGASAGSERTPLRSWLREEGVEIVPAAVSVYDGARRIGWRERWRLVLRWLSTQVSTPTG